MGVRLLLVRNLAIGGAAFVAAASLGVARAQPGHDAFDKIMGYDNGREETAAHNYLNQTGREDSYGESEVEPNQSNELNPAYNGQSGQYQNGQYQNGQRRYPNYNQYQQYQGQNAGASRTQRNTAQRSQAQYGAADQGNRNYASGQNGNQQPYAGQQNQQSAGQQNSGQQADSTRNRSYSSEQNSGQRQAVQQHHSGSPHNLGVTWTTMGGRLTAHQLSPAGELAQEGLEQGDQIVSVGGQRVRSEADFNRAIVGARAGWEVPIVVSRGGQRETIYWAPQGQQVGYNQPSSGQNAGGQHVGGQVHNGQLQGHENAGQQTNWNSHAHVHQPVANLTINARLTEGPRGNAFLGVQLDRDPGAEATVTRVYPDSPAQRAGLQPGDMLLAVNGQPIHAASDLTQHIIQFQPGDRVQLAVERTAQAGHMQQNQARQSDEGQRHPTRNVSDTAQPGDALEE